MHLNWHLEEKLFAFLDDYCETYERQMIVVTHSRVVFTPRFLSKTRFLFWEDGRVKWGPDLTADQRRRLAGDAIEIIRLGAFSKPTFFVEDAAQARVVEEIARVLSADVIVSQCDNKSNVRSLFRFAKGESWVGSYFVEDGDNEGSPFSDPQFLHLEKYCIECYLLDPHTASLATGKTEGDIRQAVFQAVIENKDLIFRKNKFFEFLIPHFTVDHITEANIAKLDASVVMKSFLRMVGYADSDYIRRYVQASHSRGSLRSVLPAALVDAIGQVTIPASAG